MEYRMLFIGNSYTYYNGGVPELFACIANSRGFFPTVKSVARGGYYLEQYLNSGDEYGARVIAELTGQNAYDFVFLQEQSICPVAEPERFLASVRRLDEMIRNQGGKTVLYQTWGRKNGHPTLTEYGWTNETMTGLLAASYQKAADELNAMLSPVGSAFRQVYVSSPDVELYAPDGTHQSLAGSYLSALCHFATIYRQSTVGVPYVPEGISAANAEILQSAAQKAVFCTI